MDAQYFGRAMATFANQGLQTSRSEATSVGQKLVQGAQKYGFKQVCAMHCIFLWEVLFLVQSVPEFQQWTLV